MFSKIKTASHGYRESGRDETPKAGCKNLFHHVLAASDFLLLSSGHLTGGLVQYFTPEYMISVGHSRCAVASLCTVMILLMIIIIPL